MKPARLAIMIGTGPERVYEISDEETLIGRGLAADVQLPDRGASRDHAMIMWEGDHFALEDLQTTNGTRLNGKKVRSSPHRHCRTDRRTYTPGGFPGPDSGGDQQA